MTMVEIDELQKIYAKEQEYTVLSGEKEKRYISRDELDAMIDEWCEQFYNRKINFY